MHSLYVRSARFSKPPVELKKSSPSSKRQLTLLAGLLLRLDKSEDYRDLLDLVRAVGEYAITELKKVTTNHLVYGDKQRAQIREAAAELLAELSAANPTHGEEPPMDQRVAAVISDAEGEEALPMSRKGENGQ